MTTPGPGRRIDAGVQPDAAQVGAQLVDRHLAALGVVGQGRQLALQAGDLAAQLVVAVVEVRDEDRQLLRGQPGERRAARLGPQLDDDEQPEDEGHGRDGELVPSLVHRQPPGSTVAPGDGWGRA